MDQEKALRSAERLLKQGRVQEALAELQRVAQKHPKDLPVLNRIGDLLARQGRRTEAVGYYEKIAQEFTQRGFLPKAVAIYKKILRLDPGRTESLFQLGNLFLKQELPGEARTYLLLAGKQYLEGGEFAQAREVYERLVAAEPENPRHRVRLAETRVAEGDIDQAGRELLEVGSSLQKKGWAEEAERTYRRVAELLPDSPGPVIGIASCLKAQNRNEEAFQYLEQKVQGKHPDPALLGELALHYQEAGRGEQALGTLLGPNAAEIADDIYEKIFRLNREQGLGDQLWQKFDPLIDQWAQDGKDERLVSLLERLAGLERAGHIPALQRLLDVLEKKNDRQGVASALERLVRAYETNSMHDEASHTREQLQEVNPESPWLSQTADGEGQTGPSGTAAVEQAAEPTQPPEDQARLQAEAPAVPLNRGDEDFVNGRLTQAEILEKYGLIEQALEQLREAARRFPGHVGAQERLVTLLRARGAITQSRDALVALALAKRAAGDTPGALAAVKQAREQAPLEQATRKLLRQLSLLDPATPPTEAKPQRQASGAPSRSTKPQGKAEIVIDFDSFEVGDDAPQPEVGRPPKPPGKRVRLPDKELLQEVQLLLEQEKKDEASKRLSALRTLGYGGEELDSLEAATREAPAPKHPAKTAEQVEPAEVGQPAAHQQETQEEEAAVSVPSLDEDDDLSAITAALEGELFGEGAEESLVPENDSEQSLEQVFAAFKRHVQEEVGSEDYRTHYDLGIAYKEMGMIDEAIGEFQIASRATELLWEACSMLALCHREKGDTAEAERWYREALNAPGVDDETVRGLRYDLAEVLLQSGDSEGALNLFRDVLRSDPSYRDVQSRVSELESRLQS